MYSASGDLASAAVSDALIASGVAGIPHLLTGVIILFTCLTALFAAGETALFAIARARLRVGSRRKKASSIDILLAKPKETLAFILAGSVASRIAAALASASLFSVLFPNDHAKVFLAAGLLAIVVLVFIGEVIPRALAACASERLASVLAVPLRVLFLLFFPVRLVVQTLSRPLRGKAPSSSDVPDEEELRALIQGGHIEGLLGERERAIIDGVLDFGNSAVDELMLPRTAIEALSGNLSQEEMLDALRHVRHSRIPLYNESIDTIIGIVHSKGILLNPGTRYQNFVREPLFVPAKRGLTDLLNDFQRGRMHLAVVVDEYGGTSGFATLADLLQEIIGVFEEEEEEIPPIRKIGKNRWIVQGSCEISDLNEELDSEVPDNMSRTIGGFVTAKLGRFPRLQEDVFFDTLTFTVLRMDANRVRLLRVQKREEEEGQRQGSISGPVAEPETGPGGGMP